MQKSMRILRSEYICLYWNDGTRDTSDIGSDVCVNLNGCCGAKTFFCFPKTCSFEKNR